MAVYNSLAEYQRYTVSVETLRNNYAALENYLKTNYGHTNHLTNLPNPDDFQDVPSSDRVPLEIISKGITELATEINEPNLGLKMAAHLADAHIRIRLFIQSSKIHFIDFLKLTARYTRIASDLFDYEIIESGEEICFRMLPLSPETISYHQYEAFSALVMRGVSHSKEIQLNRIEFAHAKPSDEDDVYINEFGLLPSFGHRTTTLYFPLRCRNVLVEGLSDTSDCIKWLQTLETQYTKLSEDVDTLDRCQFLLSILLCLGEANKERLAELLCMSPRTLQRKLKEENTSFRELLQQLRIELSQHYFKTARASCTELGFALGYQDYKQFHRAFKEWFGVSPEQYRSRFLSSEDPATQS